MREISDEFWDAVIQGASTVIDCELCGRVHFGRDGDFEEGELEDLEKKAKAEPDKYIDHGADMAHWGLIDGKQAVADCPCHKAAKYEGFIWHNRRVIVDYLKKRIGQNSRDAAKDQERIDGLVRVTPTPGEK